jgi:hypothetical protein
MLSTMDDLLGRNDPRRGLHPRPTPLQAKAAKEAASRLAFGKEHAELAASLLGVGSVALVPRTLLHEGSVAKIGSEALVKRTNARHLVLFNDTLIVAADKLEGVSLGPISKQTRKVKQALPLSDVIAVVAESYARVESPTDGGGGGGGGGGGVSDGAGNGAGTDSATGGGGAGRAATAADNSQQALSRSKSGLPPSPPPHVFVLITSSRRFHFSAASESAQEEWLEAIGEALSAVRGDVKWWWFEPFLCSPAEADAGASIIRVRSRLRVRGTWRRDLLKRTTAPRAPPRCRSALEVRSDLMAARSAPDAASRARAVAALGMGTYEMPTLGWRHRVCRRGAHSAAAVGDVGALRQLLRLNGNGDGDGGDGGAGEDANEVDEDGLAPLLVAAAAGHADCCAALIDAGAEVRAGGESERESSVMCRSPHNSFGDRRPVVGCFCYCCCRAATASHV